ncbi:hypothetical protein M23134_05589 [Microscilla marina ATCC 23134]|uniref:Uncharacterized protein n=1 Tax=Microscilla marina ATCC 23134 TaxID=313606 RepID=A1ZI49_MICM2|nr:hypothetical protein M23134_05589 [Microscilla marina ATCC 23134]
MCKRVSKFYGSKGGKQMLRQYFVKHKALSFLRVKMGNMW